MRICKKKEPLKTIIMDKIKILYFYAEWDGRYEEPSAIWSLCKKHNIRCKFIDCETDSGVRKSIKFGVRMCPTVIVVIDGKEVERINGAVAYKVISEKYIKTES